MDSVTLSIADLRSAAPFLVWRRRQPHFVSESLSSNFFAGALFSLVNGVWEGFGVLFGVAMFCAVAKATRVMADGVPRRTAYLKSLLAAGIFALFSYLFYGTRVEGGDPLMGGGESVETEALPEHRLSGSIKVFVVCLGCFVYGVYKSDAPKPDVS